MKYKITLESNLKNIKVGRNIVTSLCMEYNPTLTFINELKTIVSEALTNCIVHGYNNKEGIIDIEIITNDEYIEITITDYGVGIENVDEALTPMFSTKKENDRSGLGFTIMEVFSNKLEVVSKINEGTKILIQKKWYK